MFPGFYFSKISAAALTIVLIVQACVYHSFSPANCDADPVTVEVLAREDTECGKSLGMISVKATGGSGVYRFKVNNGNETQASVFIGLPAGIYLITATDANDCSSTIEVTIQNNNGVNLEYTSTDAGCQSSNGSITVTAINGESPYNFKIDDGSYQNGNTFTNLSSGQYTITVSDATGCEASLTTLVESGTSFQNSVKPILEANCIVSGCHNGSQFPDFRNFQAVKQNAASIKNQVVSRNMPQNGTLTQFEINQIVCWVDDGAQNN